VADLVTHAASAVLVKSVRRDPLMPVFVAGTFLPDVCSRGPALALGWIHTHWIKLPAVATYGWEPLHQPVGMLVLAFFVSMFFEASNRRAVFANLVGGMFLHLAIDLFQDHHGVGYVLGYPFVTQGFEFALIGSEATVWAAPALAGAAFFAWRAVYRRPPQP